MARLDRFHFLFAVALAGGLSFTGISCGIDDGSADDDAIAEPAPSNPGEPASLSLPTVQLQLHDATRDLAQQMGVAQPETMVAVAVVDRAQAEAAISGAELEAHEPVLVVQTTGGRFTALHHPQGQTAPSGNVLTVTYDARTLDVLDVGIDEAAPDLTRLGIPLDLLRQAAKPE